MFFFSQPFLNLDEKPDRLIVHLQETIAFILPWSRSKKITLLFAILWQDLGLTKMTPLIAIFFWTKFGTHLT